MLEYTLELNDLTPDKGDHRAQLHGVRSYSEAEIIADMLDSGSGLTEADIVAALTAYKKSIVKHVRDGGGFSCDLFSIQPSIQGVFATREDTVDGVERKVHLNLHPGTLLRDAAKQIKTHKLTVSAPSIAIVEVTDMETGSINDRITANKVIKIAGAKIKIEGNDQNVGLYLAPNDGSPPIKVSDKSIVLNRPGEIMATLPALSAGQYRVRIITQYSGSGKFLKTPHVANYDPLLTVT